jgi:hypothetical protein
MKNGISRFVLTQEMLFSEAYLSTAASDEDFVRDLYGAVLQRDADGLEFWTQFVTEKGRARAFERFCEGQEITDNYAKDDSILQESGGCGILLVTFGLRAVYITFGAARCEKPFAVTKMNLDIVRAFLNAAGWEVLGLRIARHLTDMEIQRSKLLNIARR